MSAAAGEHPRTIGRGRRLAFLLVAPALAWLVLEGLAATVLALIPAPPAAPSLPQDDPDRLIQVEDALDGGFFLLDPDVIWVAAPGYFRPADPNSAWGSEPLSLNSNGHRSPPMAEAKPVGVRRAMVLGGSHPFGMWVGGSETYSAVLQRLLDGDGGPRWEVMNAACPGHTTFQGRKYLEARWERLKPDVVVFDLGNNDTLPLNVRFAAPDHEVQAVPIWARGAAGQASISRVYQLLARALDPSRRATGKDRVRVPPDRTRANMEAVRALAALHGFRVIWMSQVSVGSDGRARCLMRLPEWSPRLDVCGLFERQGDGAGRFFVDGIHAGREGHAMIGQALHDLFVAEGLSDGGGPG